MRPHFRAAGITRIGDITGMDWIGIPVAQCIRPDAKMLAVDSGKGVTPAAARASAMMEGFERHVGETAVLESIVETASNLGSECDYRFQRMNGGSFNATRPISWTKVHEICSSIPKYVPEACVSVSLTQSTFPLFHSAFTVTTNGLSAGNNRDEAIAGGLYEVIERDQVTSAMLDPDIVPFVDLNTVASPILLELLDRLKTARVETVLFDCTRDIQVPTFTAFIYDSETGEHVYKGYAAHLDPVVAQCRAICEAVQARAVWMSGSRDDISHAIFSKHRSGEPFIMRKLIEGKRSVSSNRHQNQSCDTFKSDINVLLSLIADAGFPEPLIKEFDCPYPCSVVRILAPGMHGYLHEFGKLGKRPSYE